MDIKKTRELMGKALKDDEELRKTYIANIAMLIYDDQRTGVEIHSPRPIPRLPTNLSTAEGCNSIAERILDLILI